MKFSEMLYERPDEEDLIRRIKELTQNLKDAENYAAARAVFLEMDKLERHVETMGTLASIRNSLDSRDAYYDEERKFWNEAEPRIEEYSQAWNVALLESPFRKDFAEEFGQLMFLNTEIALKTFSPEIIPDLQKENDLVMAYEKLISSAQVSFEGKNWTIPQMTAFKSDPDDARRLAAWKAEGTWFMENQAELDRLYDELVRLRDAMGRKLGYDGYLPLGYYRMERNCYTKEDLKKFRENVVRYVVPVAEEIYQRQAERQGRTYPLSFADAALEFRSGNPRPKGTAEDILSAGRQFYDELSPETSKFFRAMLDGDMLDVISREGKMGGGYCTSLPDYGIPFIFANFNGTQGDVEVVTHEAGHGFEWWMNRDRIPVSYGWASMEASEVHSMSMEFLAWPWKELFFGDEADRFRYSHLAAAITFIPYGTMVDHFQHIVYEKPELTPEGRHGVWKELMGIYMPWMKLDGEIPFYSDGMHWQYKHHIYTSPLYYIDYCLAQTVSLEIWSLMQKDHRDAFDHYMAYTRQGGSRVFTELLSEAGLTSPFEPACLEEVCRTAKAYLEAFPKDKLEKA